MASREMHGTGSKNNPVGNRGARGATRPTCVDNKGHHGLEERFNRPNRPLVKPAENRIS